MSSIFTIIDFLFTYCKIKINKKLIKPIIGYFSLFIVVSIITIIIILFPYMEIKITYNNGEVIYNYYDNYEENIKIKYDDITGYKIKKRDIEYLQERLDSGYINYNNQKTKFIPIDNRLGCNYIESGGVIHYASADNKVLYKHKNCIPKNQHIIDLGK